MADWLKLHRKAQHSRVFSDDWLWRLWCWCLMQACWRTDWKLGRQLLPGQFLCGRNEVARQLNVSPSKVYRGFQTLKHWGQIRLEVNNRFTVVTICNWETYQCLPEELWTAGEQPARAAEQPSAREEGKEEISRTGGCAREGRGPDNGFPLPKSLQGFAGADDGSDDD